MSPRAFAACFVVLVLGAFGFVWVYEPPLSGAYEGTAADSPMGAYGPMRLELTETDGRLAGRVTLPAVMTEGGGPLSGSFDGERLVFVTTDARGNKMTWEAQSSPKHLSGHYWWGKLDEQGRNEHAALGVWRASRP